MSASHFTVRGICGVFGVLALVVCFSLSGITGYVALAQDAEAYTAGVHTLTGTVKITNPAVIEYLAVERSVGLADMVGFVKRDKELIPPFFSQPMTTVEGDIATGATYTLPLPIVPRGALNDVSNGKGGEQGVQIYAAAFDTNFFGDAFAGPFELGGWTASNASLRFDPGTNEVIGGLMIVWAPTDREMFPADFGPDGKLFTADDTITTIPRGWTVVNLDTSPFEQLRSPVVVAEIIEGDTGSVDLTNLTYTQAFDALMADLRVRYALSEFKGIDYDALIREFRPVVQRAEQTRNVNLFKLAMFRLADRFRDGHVSSTLPQGYLARFVGGFGLVLAETDSGEVIARKVTPNMAADRAGIRRGALIVEWNGKPVQQVIPEVDQPLTHSAEHTRRLTQLAFLTRTPLNQSVTITYRNPGQSETRRVRLRAEQDIEGLIAALPFSSNTVKMPITAKVLPSGLGYIQIATFTENPQLLVQTWEWALKTFEARKVPGLILDMRENPGGFSAFPTYFAGSFFDKEFVLYSSYRADAQGKFVLQGNRQIKPAPVQWTKPVAVLVGPTCASACEIFAAALARSPKTIIVGSYPTYGIAAGLFGPWLLPDGVEFNAPVIQPQNPDGTIFLENVGVRPTIKVPVTVESLLSEDDLELPIAEKALQDQIAALN